MITFAIVLQKQKSDPQNKSSFLSKLSFGLSVVCIIHCILTPIAIIASPLLAKSLAISHEVETLIYLAAFVFGLIGLFLDRSCHKRNDPILLFITGFAFILVSHFMSVYSAFLMALILGIICLISSQLMNIFLHRRYHTH